MGMVIEGSAGLTSTATDPLAIPNSDDPGALRSKITSPGAKNFASESSMNSRICKGFMPLRIDTLVRRNSSHSSVLRLPGSPANLAAMIGSSAGFSAVLPLMNSMTSWPWFMQCLISG